MSKIHGWPKQAAMLGARGAGDSSAANQYSYALNRLGSKERGNVMNTTAQSQQEIENQKSKTK